MATTLIGLDLGQTEVRAIEFQMGFNTLEPKALYHMEIRVDADETLFEAQTRTAHLLMTRHMLEGNLCICTLPSHLISTCIIEMPFKKKKLIETLLPSPFLEELLPFDVDEIWYDYQIIKEDDENLTLLVSYLQKIAFDLHYDWMMSHGVSPKILSYQPLSHVHLLPDNAPDHVVCIDLGQDSTHWSIIYKGQIQRAHSAAYGGQHITKELSHTFKLDLHHTEQGKLAEAALRTQQEIENIEDEASQSRAQVINQAILSGLNPIMRELNRTLYTYEQETECELECIYLFGGGSQLKGLLPYLSDRLGLKTAFMPLPTFLQTHSSSATLTQASTDLTVYGLGLMGAQKRNDQSINFRKDEYAYKGDLDFMRLGAVALIFTLLCVSGLLGTQTYLQKEQLRKEISLLKEDVKRLGTQLVKDDDISAFDLLEQVSNKKKLKNQVPDVSAFSTLGELSSSITKETKVDVDFMNISILNRGRFEMRGKTDTVGNVSQLISSIKKSKCFSKQVKKDQVSTTSDGLVKFRITAESSCK
jgi:Tfp pilus assembly PilM family ATPase